MAADLESADFLMCCGGQVRRITERDHYVLNQVEVSPGAFAIRIWYECNDCGKKLEPTHAC